VTDSHGRGFVVARREQGETDLFLELLLDDGRLARAVAKGGARSSRRFSAGLSPFTLYRFAFGRSPSRSSERLDEASVERAYPGVLADLRRAAAAGAASVLARDVGGELAFDPRLFELYATLLDALEPADARQAGAALVRFAFGVCEHAGHPPVLDACSRCGREAPERALVHVNPAAGGVVCGACGGGPFTLRASDRRALHSVLGGDEAGFTRGMFHQVAWLVGSHAPRGAEAIANVAGHWR
jgi:DNA repair protein RecO (recombination protein O)